MNILARQHESEAGFSDALNTVQKSAVVPDYFHSSLALPLRAVVQFFGTHFVCPLPRSNHINLPFNHLFVNGNGNTLPNPKDFVATDMQRLLPILQDLGLKLNECKFKVILLDGPDNTNTRDEGHLELMGGSNAKTFGRSGLRSVLHTFTRCMEDSDPHIDDSLSNVNHTTFTCLFLLGFPIHASGCDKAF